ncbi:MAG TPA: hypothetical protein VIL86_06630 [Tepidisphaeraceae bacterium]
MQRTPGALKVEAGMPRPQWPVIFAWIAQHVPEAARGEALDDAKRQWLGRMRRCFTQTYSVLESEHLLLFTPQELWHGRAELAKCDRVIEQIANYLGGVAQRPPTGKHVLLLFADRMAYEWYLYGYAVREVRKTAGVCLRSDLVHAVVLGNFIGTIAHELAHVCLSHLRLPRWVEEGVVQRMAVILAARDARAVFERGDPGLREFWRQHDIDDFWGGWSKMGEGGMHYYGLAAMLLHAIANDTSADFKGFLQNARAADTGIEAAGKYLPKRLEEYVTYILGDGKWEPVPE